MKIIMNSNTESLSFSRSVLSTAEDIVSTARNLDNAENSDKIFIVGNNEINKEIASSPQEVASSIRHAINEFNSQENSTVEFDTTSIVYMVHGVEFTVKDSTNDEIYHVYVGGRYRHPAYASTPAHRDI